VEQPLQLRAMVSECVRCLFIVLLLTWDAKANERSWLYRIRPCVGHKRFVSLNRTMGIDCTVANVEQLRFKVGAKWNAAKASFAFSHFLAADSAS
jgi:homogentisate 1,2-dioxygenase